MRQFFEYASVVWDGFSNCEKNKLDEPHYEAARITGLSCSVSIANSNNEIVWMSLRDGRKLQK